MLQGPGRTYTLVKVTSDAGRAGIAEAYGSPGVGVKEQVLALKPWLVGKDPLEIDKLYTLMGSGSPSLSGTRTDGSAHNLVRAVSGTEVTQIVQAFHRAFLFAAAVAALAAFTASRIPRVELWQTSQDR